MDVLDVQDVPGVPGLGLALAFAFQGEEGLIFHFVLFAWSGLACAFAPVVLCALFWKGTTRMGAIAGMIGGFSTAVLWVLLFKEKVYGLYEMWPGFGVAFALTIGVSMFTEPPD